MSAVATGTRVHTRTHTATHLADIILGSLGDLLARLGIDTSRFQRQFDQNEKAIAAWIEEGSLEQVVLECHRPSGEVKPIFEFPITYGASEAGFVDSRAAFARYLAKLSSVPSGTTYRLFCTHPGTYTPQDGWTPGTRASTDGLRSTSMGGLGEGPHARVTGRLLG
jgi:AraC-like DNA-binding protein